MTPAEQFFLEQVNRARLDPLAEAARFGIDLNDPNPSPNAPDPDRVRDYFAHVTPDGVTAQQRGTAAGYEGGVGENIAQMGTTGPLTADEAMTTGLPEAGPSPEVVKHHQGLFYSVGHRENMLHEPYREIGAGQSVMTVEREVTLVYSDGSTEQAMRDVTFSNVTAKFGIPTDGAVFLTGVVYEDTDEDGFYSIGEGVGGVSITVNGDTVTSAAAGGYALALAAAVVEVSFDWEGTMLSAQVDLSAGNVKLDLVDGLRLMSSGDLALGDGVIEAGLLGVADLSLTGNESDNVLHVGRGNNVIDGGGGHNIALFSGAQADYDITIEAGSITVADLRTDTTAQGTNTLTGIQTLRFSDGDLPGLSDPGPDPDPEPLPGPGTGPHALAGSVTNAGGAALGGAVVHLTPAGAEAPAHTFTTGVDGSFVLRPDALTGGRLDAMRAHDPVADGRPTVFDALDVLRLAVGLAPSFGPATPEAHVAADMDGNGQIDVFDALEVLRAAVGLDSAHGPRWIFVDSASLPEMNRTSVEFDPGIAISDINADMAGLHLTGILTGHMSEFG